FNHSLSMETIWKPWSRIRIKVPANCIGTVLFQSLEWIHCISFGFTHLLSIFILYMSKYNDIFIWSFIENQSRNFHQRIEPASRLIHSFNNKVCWEVLFKHLLIFKWIVILCEWHCA